MPVGNISISRFWTATVMYLPLLLLPGAATQAQQTLVADPTQKMRPVTDEMLLHPDPSDWLMWRRTYDGFGFSPLNEITRDNVKDLRVAWSWSLTNGATESTPIVHDGILYIWNYADKVQALNAATGDLIWEYRRDLPQTIIDQAGNNMAKRNMAVYQDKLVIATSDAHLVALDAKTGDVAWDHETADWRKGWRYTAGPFIVDGMVLQGMTGCGNAEPGGCFITAHDFKTGAEKWRVWTIAHPEDPNFNTWNAASALPPGSPARSTPSRTWCSTVSGSRIPGSPRCAARCRKRRTHRGSRTRPSIQIPLWPLIQRLER
jgi:alcohol dehydrogenase (cytochrome c)